MATQQILEATTRTTSGKKTRHSGLIPGILYGHGMEAKQIAVPVQKFIQVLKAAGFSSLVNVKVDDGKQHTVIIRDIQTHPMRDTIEHIDFYQVRMDKEIEAKVPLRFIGESSAVKDLGGVFIRNIDELEISALPGDLPHDIEVDISVLKNFEISIHISDITLPAGVKLKSADDQVVALVQEPRSEQEIEQLSEAVTEDVEAVEGVKKEEPVAEGEEASAEGAKKEESKEEKK